MKINDMHHNVQKCFINRPLSLAGAVSCHWRCTCCYVPTVNCTSRRHAKC